MAVHRQKVTLSHCDEHSTDDADNLGNQTPIWFAKLFSLINSQRDENCLSRIDWWDETIIMRIA